MASNTPNLNLLKKDPVTDGNDTFNIRTMLNENWDKIDAAVGEVREELQDIEIPDATLTQAGIVQLSNETNGSRENVAATEKAVSQAFQAGNERKAEVVAALVALGVPASTSETWAQLIPKMATVIRATGNAAAADLLAGKTASNSSGPITGTMPDRGAAIITPSGTAAVTIPDGAYMGAKVAQVNVPAAKVLNDTTIAGVAGTMVNQGAITITPGAANKAIPVGYHNGGGIVAGDPDLVPDNIRSGVNIFGALGTLKPQLYNFMEYLNAGTVYDVLLAIRNDGNLMTSTSGALRVFDKNGTVVSTLTWAQTLSNFKGYYNDNEIWYTYGNVDYTDTIKIFNISGTLLRSIVSNRGNNPYGRAAADTNYWYVTMRGNIRKFDKNLTLIETLTPVDQAGSGTFSSISLSVTVMKVVGTKLYFEVPLSAGGSATVILGEYDMTTNIYRAVNFAPLLSLI